ncbi:uncharacterized protein LOC100844080 [Brachypodium distachyon]|uniref:Uncharacterized protein n=1 Tax=Brachypodium distachyon TaxID=15368 RepID=A0A0Q3LMU1_BRADI|nr:uncharacterized protein LOC100844080 [Brachypodium distachyon]KQJ93781.1 hypothetical protein BRADI_3g06687v3 [Brachypodium distachyon]|eukprot:XP_003571051.2 uncharacterized protein LOC100844080 [Brachypodium distachyon]
MRNAAAVAAMSTSGSSSSLSSMNPGSYVTGSGGVQQAVQQPPAFWSTPTPYLFIGFAVVMSLIAVALAVLLCSRRRDDEDDEEISRRREEAEADRVPAGMMSVRVLAPLDREPRLVVVMAPGHDAPSFLASAAPLAAYAAAAASKAVPSTPPRTCQCYAKEDAKDGAVDAV